MAVILDGKKMAQTVKQRLQQMIKQQGITPKLGIILVGDDAASLIYVKNKQKAASEVGIETQLYHFDNQVSSETLENLIQTLNADSDVHGILVQLPLPKSFNAAKILSEIDPKKDVDGFHPYNIGLLQYGAGHGLQPATPKGIMQLIKSTGLDLSGKNALVIGRSNIVGKPMAMMLLGADCTVTMAHSKTTDLKALCQNADIIVSATGCAKLIKQDWVKSGAVVIDVGMNRDEQGKLCGDVDFEGVCQKAGFITPVPGGVGPMTIAMLLDNVVEAYLKQHQI